ncbi:MAG TPA: carbohydrate-binding protein, partial [Acidimicrobiales bacterium]
TAAASRRATALAQVQADQRKDGKKLSVWLTLPLSPTGLRADGTAAIASMLQAKVDLAGVNVMAMEYGDSRPSSQSFVSASMAGLDGAATQVRTAYRRVGVTLNVPQSYAKLGLTPMIGQNDTPADVLDTAGAEQLFSQANSRGIARFSMWSLNRDSQCAGNLDPKVSDNHCSGVNQTALQFSAVFDQVPGRATPAGQASANDLGGRSPVVTDTAGGPYDEWRQHREYDTGDRAIWQGEVYVAKWWNVGDVPNAPVVHDWNSPWRLVGPVLPNDTKPAPPSTLAPHTYPAWSLKGDYLPGDRVMRNGVGYQAKWWTRGDDPDADVDNAWQTPWEQIDSSSNN